MKTSLENIQGIDCLTVKGEQSETAVIFLHGYGANMHDLFPLWELWHKDGMNWYFPNGVESLPMGYYEGRAWFSIDMAKLEEAMRLGTHRNMADNHPPELQTTLTRLSALIMDLSRTHKKIILGGFSQGAMCSSHLAMNKDLKIDGLILLSGSLLAESIFPKEAKSIPFVQAHGSRDPILPLEGARALYAKLKALNFSGNLSVFEGGHEIPMSVIHDVKNFIATI